LKIVNFTKPFWLISDTHFFHTKLFFEFGLRTEFKDTEEVNRTMLENWNNTVLDDEYIIFLGDFVCGTHEHGLDKYVTAQAIYDSLKGRKIFLKGNHDERLKKYTKIPIIEDSLGIIYKGKRILLNHEPVSNFERNDWDLMIHGHVHNNLIFHHQKDMFNVSIESVNYKPVHIDEIFEKWGL
jgi:calcineurin-like phosphoesterase family protein